MPTATRREVLTVAAVTVTLPMLQTALGGLQRASAGAPGQAPASQPAEKPGWFATKLKAAEVKDNEFTAVDGHALLVTRADKSVTALTNVCTHRQCAMKPKAGDKILSCACHGSQFNLDGSVAKAPARTPLQHFAIRTNDAGLIEIDPGTKVAKDDKNFAITLT